MLVVKIKATDRDALDLMRNCVQRLRRPHRAKRLVFHSALIDQLTVIKGEIESMIITDTQQVDLAIKPVDKKGNPGQVDGVPAWTSSNPAVATVEPASDGLSATVKAATALGTTQISVTADADLGAGVTPIVGTVDIEVVGGQAVSLSIVAGTPAEQA
jgi:hypothetical protein